MDKYQKEFVSNLKFYRKQKQISQEQLAELTGFSTSTISCIESFHQNPSFELIIKIAQALNIHPADLFLRDSSKLQNLDLYKKYSVLIDYCEQLPEYQQFSIQQLARNLSQASADYSGTHHPAK